MKNENRSMNLKENYMSNKWYYSKNGTQCGPVSDNELKQLANSGQIKPLDQVWKEGMPSWANAGNLAGLFNNVTPQSPSSIPPPAPNVSVEMSQISLGNQTTQNSNKVISQLKNTASSLLIQGNNYLNKQTPRNRLIILSIGSIAILVAAYSIYSLLFGYSFPYRSIHSSIEQLRINQENEFAKKYKNLTDVPQIERKNAFEKLQSEANKLLQNVSPLPIVVDSSISDSISEITIGKSTLEGFGILGWSFIIELRFKTQKNLDYSTNINVRYMDEKGAVVDENEVHLSSIGVKARKGEIVNAKVHLDYSDAPKVVKMVFEQKRK